MEYLMDEIMNLLPLYCCSRGVVLAMWDLVLNAQGCALWFHRLAVLSWPTDGYPELLLDISHGAFG
jgi:hypothetical protein